MLRTSLTTLLLLALPSIAQAEPEWDASSDPSYRSVAIAEEGSDWNYSAWNASANPSYRSVAIAAFRPELAEEDNPVEAKKASKFMKQT